MYLYIYICKIYYIYICTKFRHHHEHPGGELFRSPFTRILKKISGNDLGVAPGPQDSSGNVILVVTVTVVVVSNLFDFHPQLGKISNLTNIFQMG